MNQIEKALSDYLGEMCGMRLKPHALTGLAEAAIAAMQPAPQEPVGSPAEITRLTEALRAAEEREKAVLSALEEWMFRYFWRVDGMPVEAARIHAQSRMKIAALAGAKP